MRKLILIICYWPMVIIAQKNNGIQWTELSWEQVKVKAKEEKKYIFLDCYATWCGPCKMMDKQVYPVDSVGEYINSKFISVKVQMDVNSNDNEFVTAWRKDAEQIMNKFRVSVFPTYLFFSPEGVLVYRSEGFQGARSFITTARTATKPGQIYVDPFELANRLMEDYRNGKTPRDSAFGLREFLQRVGDFQNASKVEADLYKFLAVQPVESLFTIDRLKFIGSITLRHTDRWFSLFYEQGKRVNQIMKDSDYSERLVTNIILANVVGPFLKMDMSGALMANSDVEGVEDKMEADWLELRKQLLAKYNRYYTERTILTARVMWYQLHFNTPAFASTFVKFLDRYGLNSHSWTNPQNINNFCYNIFFKKVDDKKLLKKAINWMKQVLPLNQSHTSLDTYACLLYKAGESEEALQWEKRALEKAKQFDYSASYVPFYDSVIAKMERGEALDWKK